MKKCMEFIQTNQSFRKSVNLQLDLGNYERIGSYIPTRSSVAILERYFLSLEGGNNENATILIGPYGKGKSHLLLVLLALLQGKSDENAKLLQKIEKSIGAEAVPHMHAVVDMGKKYLPVLINPIAGQDLNQTFIMALREALIRDKMENIAPESYYSEAVHTIESWEKNYPDTYHQFENLIKESGTTVAKYKKQLMHQEKEQLDTFMEYYPALTAGSVFAPMLQSGALKTYQQVGRVLEEEYGYHGIYVVFDEFSKYIEGHGEDGFSNDMRTLQDMCELANNSGTSLFLTLVAHKSIHEYAKGIPLAAKNAFRGVEGRLTEIEFVVSAQNHYELIADAVVKKEPEFSKEYARLLKQTEYRTLIEESWQLPCFQKLFLQDEFETMIAKGCFPMAPLFNYALLHISEQIAQNERTVFTFLAGDGQGSLEWLLKKGQSSLLGVDKVYDYFKGLFRETADEPRIHNEWMKAEEALARVEDDTEKAVIKAIALIRMIRREEELPAKDAVIQLALAIDKERCQRAIDSLKDKNIILYRSSIGVYAFANHVGVDVEKTITKKTAEYENKDILCETLSEVLEMKYEIPRQYNQRYAMTRFFQYVYLTEEQFGKLGQASYLFEEAFADGKIIVLLGQEQQRQEIQAHLDKLADERVLLMMSEKPLLVDGLAKKYQAVKALMQDEKFVDGNKLLLQELALYEEDIVFEINAQMEDAYLPENQNVWVLQAEKRAAKASGASWFGSLLSEICESYYNFSPKVNYELINIQNVGAQYAKARNQVIRKLLEGEDCSSYERGTSPEAMVYRTTFLHTRGDVGCQRVFAEIDDFFCKCAGERVSFEVLYRKLQGRDYGVRKGIIPLFLAKKLADTEAAAVIYVGKREMAVNYETLNKVNECPERYELYLEQETAEKEMYLQRLEELFGVGQNYSGSKQGRVSALISCMQNWYRSLPQYAMVTNSFEANEAAWIQVLRGALKRAEINPRELLFDRFPQEIADGDYPVAAERIVICKNLLDGKLDKLEITLAGCVKQTFGAKPDESLKACLLDWYQKQSVSAKNYIMSTVGSNFMKYVGSLQTNNESEIAARISKIILDVYVEDWRDDTLELFETELCKVREQIEHIKDQGADTEKQSRIILKDAKGNEIERYYEADTENSTSMYLKNVMSEALEEFGDTLEMNQKVAVLVEMLEELLQ